MSLDTCSPDALDVAGSCFLTLVPIGFTTLASMTELLSSGKSELTGSFLLLVRLTPTTPKHQYTKHR